jgi:uncharacterized protein YbbC (DUF1343 family)
LKKEQQMAVVQTGLEVLLDDPSPIRGKRIGILSHQAAVTRDLRRAVDAIHGLGVAEIARIFGPEHGFWGVKQDMEGAEAERDAATGIEILSLYTDTPRRESTPIAEWKEILRAARRCLWPEEASLADLDLLVVDLQDVGSRYYTFVNSMAYCMEVAKKTGTKVLVLDRPNPINGEAIEGNRLPEEWFSFVGQFPLPARHGMTIGELARFYAGTDPAKYGCELEILPMRGWTRSMWWDQTGLPWVPPSPNMPTTTTATIYPGMCLIEAANVSEGRGTTTPFELFGAPGIDPFELAARLEAMKFPGIGFRPQLFRPMFQKHAGRTCGGVQLHITDRGALRSYVVGLWGLAIARELLGDTFLWRQEPYEYEPADDRPAVNLLTGIRFQEVLDRGGLGSFIDSFAADEEAFRRTRHEFLLY